MENTYEDGYESTLEYEIPVVVKSTLIQWMQDAKQRIWQRDLLIKNPGNRNWYCQGYEDAMRHAIEYARREEEQQ